MFFSKWLVYSPSSCLGHVPIDRTPTPAAWHMVLHRLVLLSASNYYWMCLVSLCIQDLFAYGWCLHAFFYRDKGEDCATRSESLWTLQSQRKRAPAQILIKQHSYSRWQWAKAWGCKQCLAWFWIGCNQTLQPNWLQMKCYVWKRCRDRHWLDKLLFLIWIFF